MREVEAELVGPHGRARLADVVAEHLLQHLVQEMRRGVVRHRRVADVPRHDGADAVALGEARALEDELLVVLEPQRLDELGARAVLLLDPAGVGDLAAARRIERRLGELDLEVAVAEVGERRDRGAHVELLVADELGPRRAAESRLVARASRLWREISRCSSIRRVYSSSFTARPRSRASSCVSSIGKPYVACSVEGVVPGDLALGRRLLEDRHPALERLAEALLLGREHAVDLVAVLDELGIGGPHLLDHDIGETGQERRLHPDPQPVLRGAPDDAAQDVAAPLVRRRHALGGDERHPAAVVGEDAVRLRRVRRRRRTRRRTAARPSP